MRCIHQIGEPVDLSIDFAKIKQGIINVAQLRRGDKIIQRVEGKARRQVPIFNETWGGYADLVLELPGQRLPVIYDIKGSAGRWWDYKKTFPRASDCCQVWLYGQLYAETYGTAVAETRLLYVGWGTWAEFRVEFGMIPAGPPNLAEAEPGLIATGWITNDKGTKVEEVTRYRRVNPAALRLELERLESLYHSDLAELEAWLLEYEPSGPDWDYAEDHYDRLRQLYPDAGLVLPDLIPPEPEGWGHE